MITETHEGPREVCETCGFDSDLYNRADTISSQWVIPKVLAAAAEGLEPSAVSNRPDDTTWSIAEYVDHVREAVFTTSSTTAYTTSATSARSGSASATDHDRKPVPCGRFTFRRVAFRRRRSIPCASLAAAWRATLKRIDGTTADRYKRCAFGAAR